MRKLSIMGFLACANFATCALGQYIDGGDGHLAISNLTPVLFLMVAAPLYFIERPAINRNLAVFVLGFNAFAWLSFMVFAFRYGWMPNVAVLFFQEVEVVFALLLIWYARQNFEEFRAVARFGTIVSVIISAWYGVQAIRAGTAVFLFFGMDDKSQAAVVFCCQAFILVRYFGGTLDNVLAGVLLIFSFLTLSRLPAFFIPVMMLTVARQSRYGAVIVAGLSVAVVGIFAVAGDALTQVFKVFDRLASLGAIQGDSATSSHLLLLQMCLEMKFTDFLTFFFGAGPGNFSKALTSFPLSVKQLDSIDPDLVYQARFGKAPMHSVQFSALLDYNIAIFCLLGVLLVQAVRYLMVRRYYVELMFFASLFIAALFYSLHNKAYLFLMVTTIYILVSGRDQQSVRHAALPVRRNRAGSVLSPGH